MPAEDDNKMKNMAYPCVRLRLGMKLICYSLSMCVLQSRSEDEMGRKVKEGEEMYESRQL